MRRLPAVLAALSALAIACSGDADPSSGSSAGTPRELPAITNSVDGWKTDITKSTIDPEELIQGQTKDGIPAISDPKFLAVPDVDFLKDQEPVIAFQQTGEARAYPLQIMTWHEIVNDVVAGEPVLVTFCPLCNTAIVFDRRVDGAVLDFGVSGSLRNSDLVMFDRATETWWQQVTGEALVSEYVGTRLELLWRPSSRGAISSRPSRTPACFRARPDTADLTAPTPTPATTTSTPHPSSSTARLIRGCRPWSV